MTGVLAPAARAAVFTVISTVLAVTGHHLVSGHPVPWKVIPLAGVLLFALILPAVRSRRSLPSVVVATGAAQGALHLLLGWAGGHEDHQLHTMPGHGTTQGTHEAVHCGHCGAWMTAAHIAAALLVAWCLHRADAACHVVGQRLGDVLVRFLGRLIPPTPRPVTPGLLRPVRARAQSPPQNSVLLAHAVVRRGPPAKAAFAV